MLLVLRRKMADYEMADYDCHVITVINSIEN